MPYVSEAWRSASLKKISLIALRYIASNTLNTLRASQIVVPSWLMNLALKLVLQKEQWPIGGVGGGGGGGGGGVEAFCTY